MHTCARSCVEVRARVIALLKRSLGSGPSAQNQHCVPGVSSKHPLVHFTPWEQCLAVKQGSGDPGGWICNCTYNPPQQSVAAGTKSFSDSRPGGLQEVSYSLTGVLQLPSLSIAACPPSGNFSVPFLPALSALLASSRSFLVIPVMPLVQWVVSGLQDFPFSFLYFSFGF